MSSYVYVAREASSGREIRNSVDASSEAAAIAALLNRNLLVVSINEKVAKRSRSASGSIALADLVVFTRQLATMIDAGLAMVQSLQALADQTTNKAMRDVIKDVCNKVEGGDSFSGALRRHPKVLIASTPRWSMPAKRVACWPRFSRGWPPSWKTARG